MGIANKSYFHKFVRPLYFHRHSVLANGGVSLKKGLYALIALLCSKNDLSAVVGKENFANVFILGVFVHVFDHKMSRFYDQRIATVADQRIKITIACNVARINDLFALCLDLIGKGLPGLKVFVSQVVIMTSRHPKRSVVEDHTVNNGIFPDGKITFVAMTGKDALAKGAHAGKIIKEITAIAGGSGGGKPDMAQGGGKDESKIDEALAKAREIVKEQLN
jgi:hypothetical protein